MSGGAEKDDGNDTGKISDVLDSVEQAAGPKSVSLGDILDQLGPRSFAPLMLIVAIGMVSPVAGIPGASTVAALIIGTILAQMVVGRDRLWLPAWLKKREIKTESMEKALDFARRPVKAIEPLIKPRLQALTEMPGSLASILACFVLVAGMPLIEFVPMLSTIAAVALALFAAGFLTRDGLFMLLGYGWMTLVGIFVLALLV